MPRAPLTETQRNILQAERSHGRMQQRETEQLAVRESQHRQERVATESELASGRRNRAIVGKITETATPSDNSGLVMTTVFVWAGLIIAYILVTKPGQFAGYTGSLSNFLHKVSSTTPLFQTVPKGS